MFGFGLKRKRREKAIKAIDQLEDVIARLEVLESKQAAVAGSYHQEPGVCSSPPIGHSYGEHGDCITNATANMPEEGFMSDGEVLK